MEFSSNALIKELETEVYELKKRIESGNKESNEQTSEVNKQKILINQLKMDMKDKLEE